MNIKEAITQATEEDSWFRPFSMRGSGMAYMVKGGYLHIVPTKSGGHVGGPARARTLTEEWEVVTPDEVLSERELE